MPAGRPRWIAPSGGAAARSTALLWLLVWLRCPARPSLSARAGCVALFASHLIAGFAFSDGVFSTQDFWSLGKSVAVYAKHVTRNLLRGVV